MKLILSRKGFDSSSGGGPSPLLDDGRLISLPIPDPNSKIRYGDIHHDGVPLGALVESLSKGKINAEDRAHLDPDLCFHGLKRKPGWRPLFGQMGAAEGHLQRWGVGPGDLFLYFGWFREAETYQGGWRFKKGAPDRHILFGWFQIEERWSLATGLENLPDWARSHPHCFGQRGRNNTLYVGRENLTLPSNERESPGCGTFSKLHPDLVLTEPGRSRCHWILPPWFNPQGRGATLSYHERPTRWQKAGDHVHLHSVARGQEFVLDLDFYPEAFQWLASLFALPGAASHS